MIIHFESKFSGYMKDMIDFKEALGYSRNSYHKFLLDFDRFCKRCFPDECILNKKLVMEWGRKRAGEGSNSLKRRLCAIRQFGIYLNSVEITAYVLPSEFIGKFDRFQPYIFSDTELKSFFKAADSLPKHRLFPYREYIIPVFFRLLYCCGLRHTEARILQCINIDLESGFVNIVKTKAHKDRKIAVSSELLALCNNYNQIINVVYPDRKYFFQRPDGNAYTGEWISKQFWKCWEITGIAEFSSSRPRVGDFRHNYASGILQKWLNEGKNLYVYLPYLSAYMGHSCFRHTAYYIHLLPEQLKQSSGIDWNRFENIIPEVMR